MRPPVFINCRDRVSPLADLVRWLERAGCDEIYLLDNDSTYEPLLEYYERTPHTMVPLGKNYGPFALWLAPGAFEHTRGRSFVYTDPDIVPADDCPPDALDLFADLLERYPGINKAGFGLRIDDIPDHYSHKEAVLAWEGQFWRWRVESGAYYASIDTTFALHRPNGRARPVDAIRTGPPYVARHTPWYLDLENLPEEEAFYQNRGGTTHHWNSQELPEWLVTEVTRLTTQRPSRLSQANLQARMFWKLRWTLHGRRLVLPR